MGKRTKSSPLSAGNILRAEAKLRNGSVTLGCLALGIPAPSEGSAKRLLPPRDKAQKAGGRGVGTSRKGHADGLGSKMLVLILSRPGIAEGGV